MAYLYIFTAGTSLISNLELDPRGKGHHTWLLSWLRNRTIERLLEHPEENYEAYRRMFAFYQGKTGRNTTAEIASFQRLELSPADQLVLLGSDTAEGMFSALVNAHLMSDPNIPEPVIHWKAPGIPAKSVNWNSAPTCQGDESKRQVHVMRIPGLDPANAQGFTYEAVGNLVGMIAQLVLFARGHSPSLKPVIVFTGGFKVSLPVLAQAASWLGGVPMVGVHESSDQLILIPILASKVEAHLANAVIGWAWREGRYRADYPSSYVSSVNEIKLDEWAEETAMSYDNLEKDVKPLFAPRGSKVKLNILGEAFLAVILSKIPVDI